MVSSWEGFRGSKIPFPLLRRRSSCRPAETNERDSSFPCYEVWISPLEVEVQLLNSLFPPQKGKWEQAEKNCFWEQNVCNVKSQKCNNNILFCEKKAVNQPIMLRKSAKLSKCCFFLFVFSTKKHHMRRCLDAMLRVRFQHKYNVKITQIWLCIASYSISCHRVQWKVCLTLDFADKALVWVLHWWEMTTQQTIQFELAGFRHSGGDQCGDAEWWQSHALVTEGLVPSCRPLIII